MRTRLLFPIVFFLCCFHHLQAQKREFRGAWIATIGNIDWPSKQGLPVEQQKAEFIHRLDQMKALGCNAAIVQIRPSADAFYPSTIEPWSHYLTGKQGKAPEPFYDPLQFMIEETHKRCMEFHAWFNPFRALVDSKKNPNGPEHVTRRHPEWVVSYGGKSYLNPGIPAARRYVIDVIADVVKRYDVDAVHLDDYFYPYRIAGLQFPDAAAYAQYGAGIDKEDWRRRNVDSFILKLGPVIKGLRHYVKLGISPFGVWRNYSKDTLGSRTRGGQTNYDDLYADVRTWQQRGWIDYLLPQLYWEHGHRAAPFEVLMPWWRDNGSKRSVYYGLGLYRMTQSKSGVWATPSELCRQIRDIREAAPGTGFALYSLSNFDKLPLSVFDSIRNVNYTVAIPPRSPWIDSLIPAPPVLSGKVVNGITQLHWNAGYARAEGLRYAVYRFWNDEKIDLDRPGGIIALVNDDHYDDATVHLRRDCIYIVTALDRLWNESKESNRITAPLR